MIYILLISAYFFSFFFRVSASVVLPSLAVEWGMSATLTGFISSLYFYAYALMQPLSGNLNDRFGPLRVVSAGLAVTASGAFMFAFGNSPLIIGTGRLLTGLGLAPMISGTLVFQASSFPVNRYAFFSGITYTAGSLGAVASVSPLGYALDTWGRSWVFIILALLNLFLASLPFLNRRKDPVLHEVERSRTGKGLSPTLILRELAKAFSTIGRSRQLQRMSFFWAISTASIMAFQGLWAVSWYKAVYDVSQGRARFWATMIGIGVLMGSFLGAHIAPEAKDRKRTILFSGLAYCISWGILMACTCLRLPLPVTGIAGFFTGFSGGIIFDHLTAGLNEIAEPGFKGSLFGAMNLLTFTGVILFQWGTGAVLSFFPDVTEGTYTATGYNVTFGLVIIFILLAFSGIPGLASFEKNKNGK
jgi:MFS family permease